MLPMDVRHHRWVFEFKQSSFHLIAQALRNHPLHVFVGVPPYGMLLSPRPFGSRLARSPRSRYPELRPLGVAIVVVRVTSLSSSLFRESALTTVTNDVQYRCGIAHLASLAVADIKPPVLLRPVHG